MAKNLSVLFKINLISRSIGLSGELNDPARIRPVALLDRLVKNVPGDERGIVHAVQETSGLVGMPEWTVLLPVPLPRRAIAITGGNAVSRTRLEDFQPPYPTVYRRHLLTALGVLHRLETYREDGQRARLSACSK